MSREDGTAVAGLLAGAWRSAPTPTLLSSDTLSGIVPLVLAGGAGALAWRRIVGTPLTETPAGRSIRDAHRIHALRAAVQEQELTALVGVLPSQPARALLGKGWSIARHYPHPGLRPYGDFDLYAPANVHGAVAEALSRFGDRAGLVDLHRGYGPLDDRPDAETAARAQPVRGPEGEVWTFGAEDQLRLACLHLLGHGAWRPLWLCDVALLVETRPADFDWDYLLRGSEPRNAGVRAAVGLARDLLGADLGGAPAVIRDRENPQWLCAAVLRAWGAAPRPHGARVPFSQAWRHGLGVLGPLWERWPNPVEATAAVGAAYDERVRWPLQCRAAAARVAAYARARVRAFLPEDAPRSRQK